MPISIQLPVQASMVSHMIVQLWIRRGGHCLTHTWPFKGFSIHSGLCCLVAAPANVLTCSVFKLGCGIRCIRDDRSTTGAEVGRLLCMHYLPRTSYEAPGQHKCGSKFVCALLRIVLKQVPDTILLIFHVGLKAH